MSVNTWRSVIGYVREAFACAWQQNVVVDNSPSTLLAFSAAYACVTGIASDIAKMRIKLTQQTADGVWIEVDALHGNNKYLWVLKLLRKPNHYQNYIQFTMSWILSKLIYGNTYVLKERNSDRTVRALYILHPLCVKPLIAEDGSVWYALSADYLSQIEEGKTVPASEIIHDRMPELWHPLVGVSPFFSCSLSITMGNKIQSDSTAFFGNSSRPGGIVTVPGDIDDDIAAQMKTAWEANYGGTNSGRVAILSDGMKFEPVRAEAEASQTIDQLKWTVSDTARAFHYPEFKLGGTLPPYAGDVSSLNTLYYSDCLQDKIEAMELCLDEGLDLPPDMQTELDTESLLRMDLTSLYKMLSDAVSGGGWLKPNEARRKANMAPVEGGDTPYMQQQNYSLSALSKRDASADPFKTAQPNPPQPQTPAISATPKKSDEDLEIVEAASFWAKQFDEDTEYVSN